MDITDQPQPEKDAIIRSNFRNGIKRVKAIRGDADNLVKNLKSALLDAPNQAACGDELKAFQDVINSL